MHNFKDLDPSSTTLSPFDHHAYREMLYCMGLMGRVKLGHRKVGDPYPTVFEAMATAVYVSL
jgi:hypothetical protein